MRTTLLGQRALDQTRAQPLRPEPARARRSTAALHKPTHQNHTHQIQVHGGAGQHVL